MDVEIRVLKYPVELKSVNIEFLEFMSMYW